MTAGNLRLRLRCGHRMRQMAAESMIPPDSQAPGLADQDVEASLPKIKIGICAMDKKAKSKPMKAILQRLLAFGEFETELFGDDNILNNPVSQWPNCDCLLSWHSEGFPLKKVTCGAIAVTAAFRRCTLHLH